MYNRLSTFENNYPLSILLQEQIPPTIRSKRKLEAKVERLDNECTFLLNNSFSFFGSTLVNNVGNKARLAHLIPSVSLHDLPMKPCLQSFQTVFQLNSLSSNSIDLCDVSVRVSPWNGKTWWVWGSSRGVIAEDLFVQC